MGENTDHDVKTHNTPFSAILIFVNKQKQSLAKMKPFSNTGVFKPLPGGQVQHSENLYPAHGKLLATLTLGCTAKLCSGCVQSEFGGPGRLCESFLTPTMHPEGQK